MEVAGVRVAVDQEMRARDGIVLRADVYAPAGADGPLPVLLLRTPYGKEDAHDGTYLHPAWYARRGFLVAVQDVRGRYASEGRFDPFATEAEDGADAVAWAAGLDGSNGRVGMYGASYAGVVQLLAAIERPPALRAIAPAVAGADLFSGWTRTGGALNLAFMAWWTALIGLHQATREDRDELAARLRDIVTAPPRGWLAGAAPARLEPLAESAAFFGEWLRRGADDDVWARLSPMSRLEEIEVPALHIGGWYDIFLAGTLRSFARLRAAGAPDQRLLVGPWAHYPWSTRIGDLRLGEDAAGTGRVDEEQLRFLARHLGAGSDEPDAEPVRVFVVFANEWRTSSAWPPPGATEMPLYLSSGGSANGLGGDGRLVGEPQDGLPDFYHYWGASPVPAAGGLACCVPGLPGGCVDHTAIEQLPQVLVYTGAPLERDATLAGPVEAELFVATTAPAADYTVRLCVVDEAGSWNLAEGVARVAASTEPALVRVSLTAVAARIGAGRRLRLEVSSGSFPTYDVNPQTGARPEDASPAELRGALHAVFHDRERPSRVVVTVAEDAA